MIDQLPSLDGKIITANGTSYTFKNLSANKTYTLYVRALDQAGNRSSYASMQKKTAANNSNPTTILIEAENYKSMSGIRTENCSEGGRNVGYIDNNDWFDFSIDVPESGTYKVEYRVASPNNGAHFRFDTNGGHTVLDDVRVPSTGGWQNWTTVTGTANLTAGKMTVGIFAYSGGFNMNWIRISK